MILEGAYYYNGEFVWRSPSYELPGPDCRDTSNGKTDRTGDTCAWYYGKRSSCDAYNTESFIAREMCCTCGGGIHPENPEWEQWGINLHQRLQAPEWEINLDYE